MPDPSWPLHTARLTLRPGSAGDARVLWDLRQAPGVGEWVTRDPATFEEWADHYLEPDRIASTIVVELDGVPIGDLMLLIQDAWSQVEIADQAADVQATLGWGFHPAHGGQGYATEAVEELIRICFEDLGLRRVTADCFTANEPSWRLMERVGMRREAHSVKDALHRNGEWMDGYVYALLADEWRARHQT